MSEIIILNCGHDRENNDDLRRDVVTLIGTAMRVVVGDAVGVLHDDNHEQISRFVAAMNSEDANDKDTLAILEVKMVSFNELRDRLTELLPQHEHNKDTN